jgi:hypothetical protein
MCKVLCVEISNLMCGYYMCSVRCFDSNHVESTRGGTQATESPNVSRETVRRPHAKDPIGSAAPEELPTITRTVPAPD